MSHPCRETSIGGDRREFPETTPELLQSREELARRYWKPVYHFLQIAWSRSSEDAKDLTQSFFLWLSETDVLGRYRPEQGTFRAFLKGCLRNFALQERRAGRRLKRGGGLRFLPLEESAQPERAFDEEWRAALVDEALAGLRARCGDRRLRIFEEYTFPTGVRPTYAELALLHGIKASDVMNDLAAAREQLRCGIREVLERRCGSREELEEEWHEFLGTRSRS